MENLERDRKNPKIMVDDYKKVIRNFGYNDNSSTDISSTTLRLQTFRLQIFRLL